MAKKIVIAELGIETQRLNAANTALIKQITKLKEEQRLLRKGTKNLNKASNDQLMAYTKTDAKLKKLNQDYSQNKAIMAESTTGVKSLTNALTKEVKTMEQASKNNRQLIKLRSQLNTKTKQGQKAIAQINDKLDKNNKVIKTNASALEKQRLNIGNYGSALDRVVPGLGRFIGGLQGATTTLKGTTLGLKAFRIALIATGIGAIVIAIGLLISAFSSTQAGADKISRALAPLKGAFQAIIGIVQDLALNIFSQLKDRFTLASNSIKLQIIGIRILWNKLTGDEEEAAELIDEYNDLVKESKEAQERLNKKTEDLKNILSGANERVKEGARIQQQIFDLSVKIERKQIDTTVAIAKARLEYEKQRAVAQDLTKTDAERVNALNNAEKAQKFIADTEKSIIAMKVKQLELSQSLNDTDRKGELELAELKASAFMQEQAAQRKINGLIALRSGILKRTADLAIKEMEKQLAFEVALIDRREKIKKEREERFQKARDEVNAIRFEEELIKMEEQGASRLAIRLTELNEQQRIEEEKAKQTITDKAILEHKLALIEKKYSKIREDIRFQEEMSKFAMMQSIAGQIANVLGKQTSLGKLAAIAEAGINAWRGFNLALATLPPPFGAIQAGISLALGLKSVGKIVGISIPKFAKGIERVTGIGSETNDSIPALLSKNERIVDAKNNRKIGFDLSNEQLVTAAQIYRGLIFNNGGMSMTDKGIIKAINDNTRVLKSKPIPQANITVSEGFRVFNKQKYLS